MCTSPLAKAPTRCVGIFTNCLAKSLKVLNKEKKRLLLTFARKQTRKDEYEFWLQRPRRRIIKLPLRRVRIRLCCIGMRVWVISGAHHCTGHFAGYVRTYIESKCACIRCLAAPDMRLLPHEPSFSVEKVVCKIEYVFALLPLLGWPRAKGFWHSWQQSERVLILKPFPRCVNALYFI